MGADSSSSGSVGGRGGAYASQNSSTQRTSHHKCSTAARSSFVRVKSEAARLLRLPQTLLRKRTSELPGSSSMLWRDGDTSLVRVNDIANSSKEAAGAVKGLAGHRHGVSRGEPVDGAVVRQIAVPPVRSASYHPRPRSLPFASYFCIIIVAAHHELRSSSSSSFRPTSSAAEVIALRASRVAGGLGDGIHLLRPKSPFSPTWSIRGAR